MILWSGKNKNSTRSRFRLQKEPYLVINIIFAGIILLILVYAGIFSPDKDKYPVPCIHEEITGETCASCGLSHSLSLILRGRIAEAYECNSNGMRVFIFFVAQLFMRIFFPIYYINYPDNRKQLIILDITGSSIMFLIVFIPFFIYIFKWL